MSESQSTRFEKLGGNGTWSIYMKAYLMAKKLWKYVVKEPPSELTEQQHEDWQEQCLLALAEITLHVQPVHLPYISSCDNDVQAVWELLQQQHADNNQARKQQLWEQMVSLRMGATETVTQYISRARSIQEQLRGCSMEIADGDIQLPILNGLPKVPAYDMLRGSLRYQQKARTLSLNELQPMLIAAEQDHKVEHGGAAEHIAEAHFARSSRGGRGRAGRPQTAGQRSVASSSSNRGRSNSRGRGGRGRGGGRAVAGTDGRLLPEVDCYTCKRYGHYAEQCPTPRASTAVAGLHMARAFRAVAGQNQPDSTEWLVDSGANYHVSTSASKMYDIREPPAELNEILLGKGRAAVKGMGTLSLQPQGQPLIFLHNVLWSPGFTANLFSESRATATGGTVQFKQKQASIFAASGELVLTAPRSAHGMCAFHATAVSPAAALAAPAAPLALNSCAIGSAQSAGGPRETHRYGHDWRGTSTPSHSMRQEHAVPSPSEGSNTAGDRPSGYGLGTQQGASTVGSRVNRLPTAGTQQSASAAAAAAKWHRRLGHPGGRVLGELARAVQGASLPDSQQMRAAAEQCESCAQTKQAAKPHQQAKWKSSQPLELVHTDVCGPLPTSAGGSNYFLTVLDDYTSWSEVRLMKRKSDTAAALKEVLKRWMVQQRSKVHKVRSDRGGEYVSGDLQQWFKDQGIQWDPTAPYSPEQNGKAERLNRTLMEKVRAMLYDSEVHTKWWGEALSTANYLRLRLPAAEYGVSDTAATPYGRWKGEKPDIAHMHTFGCKAFVLKPKQQRNKLEPTSIEGIFMGYEPSSKVVYRVLVEDKIYTTTDVKCMEKESSAKPRKKVTWADQQGKTGSGGAGFVDGVSRSVPSIGTTAVEHSEAPAAAQQAEEVAQQGEAVAEQAEVEVQQSQHGETEQQGSENSSEGEPAQPAPRRSARLNPAAGPARPAADEPQVRASMREKHPSVLLRDHAAPVGKGSWQPYANKAAAVAQVPNTYGEAMASPDKDRWVEAMDEEQESLAAHNTWTLERTPKGVKPIGTRWVYQLKEQEGAEPRYKARLVAQGYAQKEGVDYEEVFAPVNKHSTMRALLAKVAAEDLELEQIDVKTAFLNGELSEDVWVKQPEGYEQGGNELSCHLNKALYGLKQAPRAWHAKLNTVLQQLGLTASLADPGLYYKHTAAGSTYMAVWVDDIMLATTSKALMQESKQGVLSVFEARDLGEAKNFVGLEIRRNRADRTLSISQAKMTADIVYRYGQESARSRDVPMAQGVQLRKEGEPLSEDCPYRALVGSLLYLAVCTRPDIAYAVGALARHMAQPTTEHWLAAKGVVRYLAGTVQYGIIYGGSNSTLFGYSDADYGGDLDSRRSTTGYVFKVAGGAVSWSSKLQKTVAVSTTEAEYMAAAASVKEAIWWKSISMDLQLGSTAYKPVLIFTDNQSALQLIKNPILHQRAKHIDVQYHFSRQRVHMQHVRFEWCPTKDMVADIMTKPLPRDKLQRFRIAMGVQQRLE